MWNHIKPIITNSYPLPSLSVPCEEPPETSWLSAWHRRKADQITCILPHCGLGNVGEERGPSPFQAPSCKFIVHIQHHHTQPSHTAITHSHHTQPSHSYHPYKVRLTITAETRFYLGGEGRGMEMQWFLMPL